jgi:hypothetical protein
MGFLTAMFLWMWPPLHVRRKSQPATSFDIIVLPGVLIGEL